MAEVRIVVIGGKKTSPVLVVVFAFFKLGMQLSSGGPN